eukprot:1341464-Amorphochlora_amoeboformis.AAC.2
MGDLRSGKILTDLPGDLILACLEFGDTKMAVKMAATSRAMKKLITTKEVDTDNISVEKPKRQIPRDLTHEHVAGQLIVGSPYLQEIYGLQHATT